MKAVLKQEMMMPEHNTAMLRQCCLITDGNSHRADLCRKQIGFEHEDLLSEALLPQVRAMAVMIAASRHDFTRYSPSEFTDEADWFAARILVLKARAFHLEINMKFMLDTANERAEKFAKQRGLAFVPAKIRPTLNNKRPENMLLMECDLGGAACGNVVENSRALRSIL